ncbi:MAG: hypothetical protein ACM3PY_14120 [Omnitrophica WOR_2 bacterium]
MLTAIVEQYPYLPEEKHHVDGAKKMFRKPGIGKEVPVYVPDVGWRPGM